MCGLMVAVLDIREVRAFGSPANHGETKAKTMKLQYNAKFGNGYAAERQAI